MRSPLQIMDQLYKALGTDPELVRLLNISRQVTVKKCEEKERDLGKEVLERFNDLVHAEEFKGIGSCEVALVGLTIMAKGLLDVANTSDSVVSEN